MTQTDRRILAARKRIEKHRNNIRTLELKESALWDKQEEEIKPLREMEARHEEEGKAMTKRIWDVEEKISDEEALIYRLENEL